MNEGYIIDTFTIGGQVEGVWRNDLRGGGKMWFQALLTLHYITYRNPKELIMLNKHVMKLQS